MKRLLLVGAGHAHVEVLRRQWQRPLPGVRYEVVDPNPRPVYSGMVPGFIAGEYRREELEIDLVSLCARAGARHVTARATRVDAERRCVETDGGEVLAYDLASLDIGSTVAGIERVAGSARVLPSRPIPQLVASIEGLLERARDGEDFAVCVVGGGAGGVEVAFCLDARLRKTGAAARVTLLTDADRLLPGGPPSRTRRITRAAASRGIGVRLGARVAGVADAGPRLESGELVEADAVLWVTGPAAHPLAADSGLPVDEGGFVHTEDTLRVRGREDLFAVGDCAALPGAKAAGVYAVRSAPVLDHNLRASVRGAPLRRYRPQKDFLSILNLGDGTAVGTKWGVTLSGRWMLWIKDRIDRAFMARYA